MAGPVRMLLVEDDEAIATAVRDGLRDDGYEVDVESTGLDALIALGRTDYSIAAVDVMLPGMDGFELCRRIREGGYRLPVLMLTARDAVEDRVRGLDVGADDYLTKPFAFPELAARLRALTRRHEVLGRTDLVAGDVVLRLDSSRVEVAGAAVSLSPREFQLLRLLASRAGEVVSRDDALDEVWGTRHIEQQVVDQYIAYLRRKLRDAGSQSSIETVRGRGYRLEAR
ncbi:response regulator transcription factor [Schumannella luteola]